MAALTKEEFYNKEYAPTANWNELFYTNPRHFQSANAPSDYKSFLAGKSSYTGDWSGNKRTYAADAVDKNAMLREFDNAYSDYKETAAAADEKESLAQVQSRENTYNSLADQIAGLTGGGTRFAGGTPTFNEQTGQYMTTPAVQSLSANNNFGATDLSSRLNFQVSDDQILNDYNNSRLGTLRSITDRGNAQIAGITERLNSAQTLLDQLPAGDPRRASSDVYVKQLKSDLSSVQSAIVEANSKIQDFKPITAGSPEAASQITSFREYLQLPEERATQQLRQIDPESYETAVGLGRQYREMATEPLGDTTTAQTEELRNTIEQEALNQLRLGSTIGAEERRGDRKSTRLNSSHTRLSRMPSSA